MKIFLFKCCLIDWQQQDTERLTRIKTGEEKKTEQGKQKYSETKVEPEEKVTKETNKGRRKTGKRIGFAIFLSGEH